MVPLRLISLGKQFVEKIDWENITWGDKGSINLPHVIGYYFGAKTDKMSIAKTYEDENTMIVTLQIPKSNYKNKSFQNLLKCPELPVQDEYYYRDWAVHMVMAGDNEKTVLFSHGRITLDVKDNAKADYVTVEVVIKQKEDMLRGVVFGLELEETYKEAREKINNPVGLNVVVPVVAVSSGAVLTGIKNAKEITEDESRDLEENSREFASSPYSLKCSAFSMGSDVYDNASPIGNSDAVKIYNDEIEKYKKNNPNKSVNPAKYFYDGINVETKYYYINNKGNGNSANPSKAQVISHMRSVDIVYLATHGSKDGLWFQEIDLQNSGRPTVHKINDTEVDFLAIDKETKEFLPYKDVTGYLYMKWLIIAGCSQLQVILPDGSKDATKWGKQLIKNNTVHGILGYNQGAPTFLNQNIVLKIFLYYLQVEKKGFVDAWAKANTKGTIEFKDPTTKKVIETLEISNKFWAVLYKEKYKLEGLEELSGAKQLQSTSDNVYYDGIRDGWPWRQQIY